MPAGKQRFIGLAVSRGFAFFRHILEGVRRYADQRPEWVFVSLLLEKGALRAAGSRVPDGLIVSFDTPAIIDTLRGWKRPVVDVSLMFPSLPYPTVRVDNRRVAEVVYRHFYDCGLREFAFAGDPRWLYSNLREQSFAEFVKESGAKPHVFHTRVRQEFDPLAQSWPADRRILEWLQQLPKPVGIFVPDDLWGVQVLEACRQLGIRVPEQVAVVGVDDDDLLCGLARPRLSSVALPTHQIGFEAARLLDKLIDDRKRRAPSVLLPPIGLIARQSTDILATDDLEVVDAIRYVRDNAHRPLRIDDILKEIPVGRRTLERRVRKFLGRSLGQEIQRVHLERAKKLLAGTDLPIAQVAKHSGFTDGRHLAVLFQRQFGQTATKYRLSTRGYE